MDYIISRRLSSGCLYAYYKSRFWFWDEERCIWKESHLMSQRFEREHAVRHSLIPERFMSDLTKFQLLDKFELDGTMLDALKDAKPCQNAPIEPVAEDVPGVPAVVSAPDATPPDGGLTPSAPAPFDFSVLGDLSGQAAEADSQFDLHYGAAQDEYLISCIYLAKIHALTAKAGRYGGGTWTKWYESKGLSEGSARTMVKNGDAFKSATVADLKQLPELTRKDLNLIARSGCAGQLVETAGDSQRVQELLTQLKAEKERAERAFGEIDKQNQTIHSLLDRSEEADARADKAESDYKAALADVKGLHEQNAELEAQNTALLDERDGHIRQIRELENKPAAAYVDEDEIERRVGDRVFRTASDMTEELRKEKDAANRDNAALKKQLAAVQARLNDTIQQNFEGADSCIRLIRAAWDSGRSSFATLTGEDLDNAVDRLNGTLNSIMRESISLLTGTTPDPEEDEDDDE